MKKLYFILGIIIASKFLKNVIGGFIPIIISILAVGFLIKVLFKSGTGKTHSDYDDYL